MTTSSRLARFAIAGLLSLSLAACSESAPSDFVFAQITNYNHTADYIHEVYVDEAWSGNSFAYGGGGKFVCCLKYPRVWKPGLQATVRWTTASSDPQATAPAVWHEKVVPIDRYAEPGTTLNVHFLPNGEVRLVISSMGSGHPDYPGPAYPVKPADFKFD